MAQGRKSPSGKAGTSPRGAKGSVGRSGTTKAPAKQPGRPGSRPPGKRKPKSIVNQRETPWGLIVTIVVIVLFAGAIIGVVLSQTGGDDNNTASGNGAGAGGLAGQIIPNTPTGSTTTQKPVKRVTNTTGVDGVIAYDTAGYPAAGKADSGTLQHQHVTGPVKYSVIPPVGGPHNATWMNAGVYTMPIPSERAVHNLEHGAVWITYDPNLAASKVKALRAFVAKQSVISESDQATGLSGQANRYIDLSPWASNSLPSPIVMSSWGYQLRLTSPTDPRMQKFVDTFRNSSKYTPEFGSAVDSIPVQTGGVPAYDGSKKANPTGSAQ